MSALKKFIFHSDNQQCKGLGASDSAPSGDSGAQVSNMTHASKLMLGLMSIPAATCGKGHGGLWRWDFHSPGLEVRHVISLLMLLAGAQS